MTPCVEAPIALAILPEGQAELVEQHGVVGFDRQAMPASVNGFFPLTRGVVDRTKIHPQSPDVGAELDSALFIAEGFLEAVLLKIDVAERTSDIRGIRRLPGSLFQEGQGVAPIGETSNNENRVEGHEGDEAGIGGATCGRMRSPIVEPDPAPSSKNAEGEGRNVEI